MQYSSRISALKDVDDDKKDEVIFYGEFDVEDARYSIGDDAKARPGFGNGYKIYKGCDGLNVVDEIKTPEEYDYETGSHRNVYSIMFNYSDDLYLAMISLEKDYRHTAIYRLAVSMGTQGSPIYHEFACEFVRN